MKKFLLLGILLFGSSAVAQTQYAMLSGFEKNTIQTDKVDLVTPQVAVSRGVIAAAEANQYKMVFANQNPALVKYTVAPKASVTLLTFPNLTPKTSTLETLKLQLENSEKLPSEFIGGKLFEIKRSGKTITALREVNTRAITGVYEQAVYISRRTTFNPFKPMLDFVYAYTTEREMRRDGQTMQDNPGGLYISNNNPALRQFVFAKNGKIRLLKNAAEYINVSAAELEKGLNGTVQFGWSLNWDTHFYATISEKTGEVFELRQGYEP